LLTGGGIINEGQRCISAIHVLRPLASSSPSAGFFGVGLSKLMKTATAIRRSSRDPRMLTISRNLLDRLVAREPRQRLLRGSQRGRERGAEKNKLSRKRGCSLVAIMDRRSSAVLRGPPLITAHNRGFHQKVSQVRIHTPPPRPRGRGRGRGQRRGVLANSDMGYPLRISAGRILSYQSLLASSPATRLSPHPTAATHPLWRTRYLAIYLSIGWMSEGTNQALMHAKCRERGEINSHPHSPAFSRIFHAAAAAATMSSHTGRRRLEK